jgi:hypothetical protein
MRYTQVKKEYRLTFAGKDDINATKLTGAIFTNAGSNYTSLPTITFTNGGVNTVYILNGGAGYGGNPPTITINPSDGNGSGATASCTVVNGSVSTITVTATGSGYTSSPIILFTPYAGVNPTIQAVAQASINQSTGYGAIVTARVGAYLNNIDVTNPGYGYTVQPIVSFYGGGQAEAGAITVTGGVITNIAIASGGSFYSSPPFVVISDGAFITAATATATITNGSITAINITSGGTGYTVNPTVSFYGGGQAEAICNIEEVLIYGFGGAPISLGFVVDSITLTNQGAAYTGAPNIVISGGTPVRNAAATANIASSLRFGAITVGNNYTSPPTITFTGGTVIGNNNATAICTVSGGAISTVTFTNAGLYSVVPTGVVFNGGGGNGANVALTLATGGIVDFKMINQGKYYSGTPTISFSGGGGTGASSTAVMTYYGLGKTYDNTAAYNNLKKFRFSLNNNFHNVSLGENAKVTIESLYIPSIINEIQDTQKIVRLCGVSDSVFDTERGLNNSPIIYSITTDNILLENAGLKSSKSFKVPKDFLSKNYIEFEISVDLPSGTTSDIRFGDNNFMASIIIYEEELEQTDDINLAPTVNKSNYHKY